MSDTDVGEFLGRLMHRCDSLGDGATWAEMGKMGGYDGLGAMAEPHGLR